MFYIQFEKQLTNYDSRLKKMFVLKGVLPRKDMNIQNPGQLVVFSSAQQHH